MTIEPPRPFPIESPATKGEGRTPALQTIVRAGHKRIKKDLDAAALELACAILAHPGLQIGQQHRAAFDQEDFDLARIDRAVELHDASEEVDHLAGRFDARKAAADEDERQQTLAFERLLGDVRKFEHCDDVIA